MQRYARAVRVLLASMLLLLAWAWAPGAAWAQEPHRAGLIVVYGEGDIYRTCITFTEDEISGLDLLLRSDLEVLTATSAGIGSAVCKIEDVGCTVPDEACFCQCQGAECRFWNYWVWQNGQWVKSGVGASRRAIHDGDLDAWVWGDGTTAPPVVNVETLCAAGTATNTPVPPSMNSAQSEDYPPQGETPSEQTGDYPPPDESTTAPTATTAGATVTLSPTEEEGTTPGTEQPTPRATGTPRPGTATPLPSKTARPSATLAPRTTATLRPGETARATAAGRSTEAGASGAVTPVPGESGSTTPDKAASLIAKAATDYNATTTPEGADSSGRGYWVFFGLAGFLLLAVGYVALTRRSRPGA